MDTHTDEIEFVAQRREAERAQLVRLTKGQLVARMRRDVRAPDGRIVEYLDSAQPPERWLRDEVVAWILK